jgi:hypothetical protein
MDRYPQPGSPEGPETEEMLRRKRRSRLLDKLRALTGASEKPRVIDLSDTADQGESAPEELWSREEAEDEAVVPRVQQLGRAVVEQSRRVDELTGSVVKTVEGLPTESREQVEPQAVELKTRTEELHSATEELDKELEDLEDVETSPSEVVESTPEAPKKDRSEAMDMAKLVIATLIGGGLGALVGEGMKGSKEKKQAKQKVTMARKIDEQKAKIDAQEVEIDQLKAKKPEAGAPSQKEYIEKASELAKTQTELTRATTEQVRAVAEAASEVDKSFKIPEQEVVGAEQGAERLRERAGEQKDKGDESKDHPTSVSAADNLSDESEHANGNSTGQQSTSPTLDKALTSRTWAYVALLVVAGTLALGFLLFG